MGPEVGGEASVELMNVSASQIIEGCLMQSTWKMMIPVYAKA